MAELVVENLSVLMESTFSDYVSETYGKPYRFQQQGPYANDSYYRISVPATITEEEDVKFERWKNLNPYDFQFVYDWERTMFFERDEYPPLEPLLNDLHKAGVLAKGKYILLIEW